MSQRPDTGNSPDEQVTIDEKASLLRRIRKLEFPPEDQLDETLRQRLPSLLDASRRPTTLDIALIADACGVTWEYLLGEPEPEIPDPHETLIEQLVKGGLSRRWAERVVREHNAQLARRIREYPRASRPTCGTTQHCAYHGWCHRCDPERAGMDRAARLITKEPS